MTDQDQNNDLRIVSFPKSLNISCIETSIKDHNEFISKLEIECIDNPEAVVDKLQDANIRHSIKLPTIKVKPRQQNQIQKMYTESSIQVNDQTQEEYNNIRFDKHSYLQRRNAVLNQLEEILKFTIEQANVNDKDNDIIKSNGSNNNSNENNDILNTGDLIKKSSSKFKTFIQRDEDVDDEAKKEKEKAEQAKKNVVEEGFFKPFP